MVDNEEWQRLALLEDVEIEMMAAVFPNPRCLPWCDRQHKPTEFAGSGGLLCSRTVATGDGWAVHVDGGVWSICGDEDLFAPLTQLDVALRISDGARQMLEQIPVGEGEAFARGVAEAAALAREVAP